MFLLIFSSLASISEPCHVVDKEALLEFKSRIAFDPSKQLHSWTSMRYSNWCSVRRQWHPSRNIHVRNVDLGNLSGLQVLDLCNLKQLHGPIPPELATLSHLRKFFLYSNKFNGGIPANIPKPFAARKLVPWQQPLIW